MESQVRLENSNFIEVTLYIILTINYFTTHRRLVKIQTNSYGLSYTVADKKPFARRNSIIVQLSCLFSVRKEFTNFHLCHRKSRYWLVQPWKFLVSILQCSKLSPFGFSIGLYVANLRILIHAIVIITIIMYTIYCGVHVYM